MRPVAPAKREWISGSDQGGADYAGDDGGTQHEPASVA